jgi:hypothetical protein
MSDSAVGQQVTREAEIELAPRHFPFDPLAGRQSGFAVRSDDASE